MKNSNTPNNSKITTLNTATVGTVQMKNDIESGNPVETGQALLRLSNSLEISNQLKDVRLGLAEEKAKLNAVQNQIKNISQNLYVILESSFSLPPQKTPPPTRKRAYRVHTSPSRPSLRSQ